jgi:membrane protease YdiL (CAAX protease family)
VTHDPDDLDDEGHPSDVEEGDGIDWLDPDESGAGSAGHGAVVTCWRCGKTPGAESAVCPYCRARLAAEDPISNEGRRKRRRPPEAGGDPGIGPVLYLYMAILLTSVIYGWAINFSMDRNAPVNDEAIRAHLYKMLAVGLVDTVLVLIGIAWAGRPAASPPIGIGRKLSAWAVATPALALLLVLNFGYFRLLKDYIGLPVAENPFANKPDLVPWLVLIICVQPALVEELFFRYLALGHLRGVVGTHGAVLVSSVMFGLAHIFNPLGIPYLIVAGMVFGYARVFGRSMLIPILMHFAHNALVLWLEPWL